ncbi:hypothetical protein M3J09_011353 [Ascochyta lentis]
MSPHYATILMVSVCDWCRAQHILENGGRVPSFTTTITIFHGSTFKLHSHRRQIHVLPERVIST